MFATEFSTADRSDRVNLFDTPPEPVFDRLTDLASRLLETPVALLSLVDQRRQFFKSITGLTGWAADARETPLSHSFCQHVVASGEALVVEDARSHPLVRDNRAVDDLGVIAYLGEPVHTADGAALGALCAIDGTPRAWSARDRAVLRALADAVDAEISLRESLAAQQSLNARLETARREAEAARGMAERALDERTRVFAALGHELRTPLNGVFGGLSLLETTTDPDERARYATMIRDSGETLMKFVDNVVAYARAASGAVTPHVAEFDPVEPAESAIRTCAGFAQSRGLSLRLADTPEDLVPCLGDADLVDQIITNLIGNAIKYTPHGGVTVTVDQSASATVWRVRDTGPGVPGAMRDKIFHPFERGDPATAATASGSGLGLSVARLTAETFGAALTLDPTTGGEGAVFALSLPRSRMGSDARAGSEATLS
jgi:signal transduction histidine kinase